MSLLHSLAAQLPPIDSRSIREIDQDIRDELEFHLAMRTEENIRHGMSPDAAQSAAAAQFGDFELIQNTCRRTQLGERIMLQRLQIALMAVLLVAVLAVGYQSYSAQRMNQTALADVAAHLERLGAPAVGTISSDERGAAPAWEADRPRVVATVPAEGADMVDPRTTEIRVTFDKPMTDGSWSWVRSSAEAFPDATGDVHYEDDKRTCVMPVKLKPGTKYVVWINTANYQNFKDREGRPAVPHLLSFQTALVDEESTAADSVRDL